MTSIVLVGPHGAGKSTLGAALARALGWSFHDELGRRLAEDPTLRPVGRTAESAQEGFDEALFDLETARDLRWPRGAPRIIETWHPGNLAYAELRSPGVGRSFRPLCEALAARERPIVIPVTASPATLAARQSEPGSLEFFAEVGERAIAWAHRLGLEVFAPVRTDLETPAALAAHIIDALYARPRSAA